jgi:hypothetical protein
VDRDRTHLVFFAAGGGFEYRQALAETSGNELMLLASAAAIFGASILTVAAFGAGFWIEKRLPASFAALERVVFQCLAGLGTLSLALFLIGQIVYTRSVIAAAVAVSVLLAIQPLRRLLRAPTSWKLQIDAIAAAVIVIVLLVTVVAGLAEITGDWENDAIAYHLLGPKVWLRNGIIRPLPETSTTAFPSTIENLFGALFVLGGNRAPGLFAVVSLALAFVVVYSLARAAGLGERRSWWSVAFVAAMPAFYAGAHSAFIDVAFATFILAAARIGLEAERDGDFVVFGLFCGFALATKYTALTSGPALILCAMLAKFWREARASISAVRLAAHALLAAAAVSWPYYVRNWMLLGFPIYPPLPVVANLVPVKYMSPAALHAFYEFLYRHGGAFGKSLSAFFLLPYNLTYHTSLFNGAGGIGLTGLAFGPFGLPAARRNAFAKALALLGFLFVTSWFLAPQESRYLIPAYPIAAVIATLGWSYVESVKPPLGRILCGTVIVCSVLYGLFMIGKSRGNDLHRALSPSFAEAQRAERIPYLMSFEYLNFQPAAKRVLVLDRSVPVYYLNKDYLKPFGQWGEQVLPEAQNSAQVLAELPSLHVTHILDVRSPVGDFQVPPNARDVELVFEAENQRVYRVR